MKSSKLTIISFWGDFSANNSVNVILSRPICFNDYNFTIKIKEQLYHAKPIINQNGLSLFKKYLKLEILTFVHHAEGDSFCNIQLNIEDKLNRHSTKACVEKSEKNFHFQLGFKPFHDLNEPQLVDEEVVKEQMKALTELHEYVPENKWVLLALVNLNSLFNKFASLDIILSYIDKLLSVDQMRAAFYDDLKSTFLIKSKLYQMDVKALELNLSSLSLTTLRNAEFLSSIVSLNLSSNRLVDLTSFQWSCLVKLRNLNLANNLLKSCSFVVKIGHLDKLSLENNQIEDEKEVYVLDNITTLSNIDLRNNPFCKLIDQKLFTTKFPASFNFIL